jgi:hypothetical protein
MQKNKIVDVRDADARIATSKTRAQQSWPVSRFVLPVVRKAASPSKPA